MNIGVNFAGGFENLDELSTTLFRELGENLVIRIPGGAISRFHDPFNVRKGWGISEESVNAFFDKYGDKLQSDEDSDGGRDTWLRKASEQPDYSYMDTLVSLQASMPTLKVIYVANVFTSTAEDQMRAISYMKELGVNIEVVEFGNEVYGKYDFDTTDYIATCEPLIDMIKTDYPDVKISLISGNFKGRRDHDQWNQHLSEYVNDSANRVDYVTLHFYIGEDLAPEAYASLPAPKVVDYSTPDSELTTACANYLDEVYSLSRFQEEIDMAKALYTTGIIVTEWNNNPSQKWCNTLVNSMWIYKQFLTLSGVDYLCLHNGPAPDIYGIICLNKKQDDTTLEMVPRVSYYALKLANSLKGNGGEPLDDEIEAIYFLNPGVHSFPFINVLGSEVVIDIMSDSNNPRKLLTKGVSYEYIDGKYLYSSAGATGFQSKTQPPSMEISGVKSLTENESTETEAPLSIVLKPYSFGVVSITLEEEVIPNQPPVADAGGDKSVRLSRGNNPSVSVDLDGTASHDPDGEIVSYEWSTSGDIIGLSPIFTATFTEVGDYTFTLTVTDDKGDSSSDDVTVSVTKRRRLFSFPIKFMSTNGASKTTNS